MGRSATLPKLTPQERKPVDTCARYLLNNAKYLKYDDYLKAGFPIATEVIEGACRHLMKAVSYTHLTLPTILLV